jgi:hypothetical protein
MRLLREHQVKADDKHDRNGNEYLGAKPSTKIAAAELVVGHASHLSLRAKRSNPRVRAGMDCFAFGSQ